MDCLVDTTFALGLVSESPELISNGVFLIKCFHWISSGNGLKKNANPVEKINTSGEKLNPVEKIKSSGDC